jgi:hypothetical protein
VSYQTQWNAYIAYKAQTALGAQASGTGAAILRTTGGAGGRLTKAAVESQEISHDAMSTRGRHGTQKTTGTYTAETSIGSFDDILEAVMRGAWEAALTITEATGGMSSATLAVGASTITASAGSWITSGLRVGDVMRLTAGFVAGNLNRNLRITGLTATVVTVAETLTVEAGPLSTYTVVRKGQKLINPAAGSIVKPYFTVEEHEIDIDGSEVFTDCQWGSLRFQMQPNGLLTIEPTWVGTGQMETKTAGDSPFFTSPSETTSVPLAVLDASLLLGGAAVVDLTSFDLTIDNQLTAPDVAASKFAPDVFDGQQMVGMNLTALRQDLAKVADFLDETVLSLQLLAVENEAEPKDFLSIYVPNFTLGSVDKSALSKQGGPRTQTFSVAPALVGRDDTGGAFDACMVKFQVSNDAA